MLEPLSEMSVISAPILAAALRARGIDADRIVVGDRVRMALRGRDYVAQRAPGAPTLWALRDTTGRVALPGGRPVPWSQLVVYADELRRLPRPAKQITLSPKLQAVQALALQAHAGRYPAPAPAFRHSAETEAAILASIAALDALAA